MIDEEALKKRYLETSHSYGASCPACHARKNEELSSDCTKNSEKKSIFDGWFHPAPHQNLGGTSKPFITALAPMVDQSELAFRMLTREYGANLCYTPMFHARLFVESETYRSQHFTTCEKDRPLLVQFCANDPDTLLQASRYVESQCDGIDLNLGCPQGIARKGHYGSFLMEDWDLVHSLVHTLAVNLSIPVTVKIRIFRDTELTKKYAMMLVDAGASLIAVHGRTRDMKGNDTGLANWDMIRTLRQYIPSHIPILANGNILCHENVLNCIQYTNVQGVLSAEGLLHDPRLFSNPDEPILWNCRYRKKVPWTMQLFETIHNITMEYLAFARQYDAFHGHVKAHLFKLMYHMFVHFPDERMALGRSSASLSEEQEREEDNACSSPVSSKKRDALERICQEILVRVKNRTLSEKLGGTTDTNSSLYPTNSLNVGKRERDEAASS